MFYIIQDKFSVNITTQEDKTLTEETEFDIIYDGLSPCCNEPIHWEWNDIDYYFHSECHCGAELQLKPTHAEVQNLTDESDND